jgi:hypothetical protein
MTREELRRILEGIHAEHGTLTAALVVKVAGNPRHPLHGRIWGLGDEALAQRAREDIARGLIRTARITIKDVDPTHHSPLFLRSPTVDKGTQGYDSITNIASRDDLVRQSMQNEFLQLGGMYRRLRNLAETFDALDQLDDLLREVGLERRVAPKATGPRPKASKGERPEARAA